MKNKTLLIILFLTTSIICKAQTEGEKDTSRCAVYIVNIKKCISTYTVAREVMRYDAVRQTWSLVKYLHEVKNKQLKETRRKKIVHIESLM